MLSSIDVVIAGLASNGAAALRNLSRQGYSVVGISHDATEVGCYSQHGTKLILPDPMSNEDDWVRCLLEAFGNGENRPVLIPTSDRYVLAIDSAAARLRGRFRFHGFGTGLRSTLTSKKLTFELAESHGFPTPRTIFVDDKRQLEDFAKSLNSHVLIKPEFSLDWRSQEAERVVGRAKVICATSVESIIDAYERIRPICPRLIAQEIVPGPDRNLIYWAGFMGSDGELFGRLIGRKLRVRPIHLGSATFVQLADMPDVEELCEGFLRSLGYEGICGIELKIDERDGTGKLIEVNARYGLWEDIGVPVGVDLVRDAVTAATGGTPIPRRPSSFSQKWIHLRSDFGAFLDYRSEDSLNLVDWITSLRPPILVNDFPLLSDVKYSLHNLKMILRSIRARSKKN